MGRRRAGPWGVSRARDRDERARLARPGRRAGLDDRRDFGHEDRTGGKDGDLDGLARHRGCARRSGYEARWAQARMRASGEERAERRRGDEGNDHDASEESDGHTSASRAASGLRRRRGSGRGGRRDSRAIRSGFAPWQYHRLLVFRRGKPGYPQVSTEGGEARGTSDGGGQVLPATLFADDSAGLRGDVTAAFRGDATAG